MPGSYIYPLKRIFLNLSGGTVTGDTVFTQGLFATQLSGGTIYSGGTDLSLLITQAITSATTSAPYLPLSGGTGGEYFFTGNTTASTIFTNTISASTIFSGSTDLYDIFQQAGTDIQTSVQPGSNITTGGTLSVPIISLVGSPSINNLFSSGSSQLNVLFASQVSVNNNSILLNYNPTANTISTSLGAGFIIQDGSGVASTDVFFDIRGTLAGIDNRSFATNLNDIRIRESGSTSSPNGVRLLAEYDYLDGGFY